MSPSYEELHSVVVSREDSVVVDLIYLLHVGSQLTDDSWCTGGRVSGEQHVEQGVEKVEQGVEQHVEQLEQPVY